MIAGINYPWTVLDGKPNYGCDFGRNKWGSHAGVTTHLDDVRADFTAMAGMGVEVARWFVFTDGRGGVEWNASGELVGLAEKFDDDMSAALEIATASKVRLCLVLVDFAWLDDPARRAALDSSAFVDRVLDPFLDKFGRSDAIHSLDIINEPDWVTEGLATDPKRGVWPIDRLRDIRRIGCRPHPPTIERAGHARRRAGALRERMGRRGVPPGLRANPFLSRCALPGSR